MNSGACEGSWFLARNPASGSTFNSDWLGESPLMKRHLAGATLSACRYDLLLAVANASKNRVFSVRHFNSIPESVELPSGLVVAKGGFSKACKTT